MDRPLQEFTEYLRNQKSLSENSILAYSRDAGLFIDFLNRKAIANYDEINNSLVLAFLYELRGQGKSEATISRKLASLRAYFSFLQVKKLLVDNPAVGITAPKTRKKSIEYLSGEEMERLLNYPGNSMKGIRDKALLEILYASGMRVSELVGVDVGALNIHVGFVMIEDGFGKPRVIPLGRPARAALEKYVYELREMLVKSSGKANGQGASEEALFLNMNGERLTRQGVWKIIKDNAKGAGIEKKITPQILRNTFAVHMVQNGADIKTLQELMGHEDVTATEVYMEFSKNRIKDVYDSTHPRA